VQCKGVRIGSAVPFPGGGVVAVEAAAASLAGCIARRIVSAPPARYLAALPTNAGDIDA